jgi:hypothetical protein
LEENIHLTLQRQMETKHAKCACKSSGTEGGVPGSIPSKTKWPSNARMQRREKRRREGMLVAPPFRIGAGRKRVEQGKKKREKRSPNEKAKNAGYPAAQEAGRAT